MNDKFRLEIPPFQDSTLTSNWEGIVWPSIGNPSLVEVNNLGSAEFSIYVCSRLNVLPSADKWKLKLIPVNNSVKHQTLDAEKIEIINYGSDHVAERGKFSQWVIDNSSNIIQIRINVKYPQEKFSSRNILYDLRLQVGTEIFTKPGAVYFQNHKYKDNKVLISSDIHVSARWDKIVDEVNALFPKRDERKYNTLSDLLSFDEKDILTSDCFSSTFINPNKNFKELIKKANDLHRKGQLDFIVLVGDLVDFKYKHTRSKTKYIYTDTEWSFFEDILMGRYDEGERLEVPVFFTAGNHDYRLHPYKIQIYGLRHCGIPIDFSDELLRRNNEYLSTKYRLEDLDAIRINTGKNHSLYYYYRLFNPFDDYYLDHGERFVFLDAGSDTFCHLSEIFSTRAIRFITETFKDLEHPTSFSFNDQQVRFIQTIVHENDTTVPLIVFCHAPLLNTRPDKINPIDLLQNRSVLYKIPIDSSGNNQNDNSSISFEKDLVEKGLGYSTVYRNQLPILRALCGYKSPSIIFSGHNHRQIDFGINKSNGDVYAFNINKHQDITSKMKTDLLLMQFPSLGHIQRSEQEFVTPSFHLFSVYGQDSMIIDNIPLIGKPFDNAYVQMRFEKEGNQERVKYYMFKGTGFNPSPNSLYHRIVIKILSANGEELTNAINISQKVLIGDVLLSKHDSTKNYYSYLIGDIPVLEIALENREKNSKVVFIFEHFEKNEGGYVSLGIVRHHQELF